jgi:hypothetical protein
MRNELNNRGKILFEIAYKFMYPKIYFNIEYIQDFEVASHQFVKIPKK